MLGVYGRLCFCEENSVLVKILRGPPSDHFDLFKTFVTFLLWQSQEQVVSTLLFKVNKVIPKVTLSLGPSLTLYFIPNLSVVGKESKIGYLLLKLGIDSRFSGFYFDKYVELKFIDHLLIFISYIISYLYTIYILRKVICLFCLFGLFVVEISQTTVLPSCSWYRSKALNK
jgi:hypothetical protein